MSIGFYLYNIGFYLYNSVEEFLIAHRSPRIRAGRGFWFLGEKFRRPRSKMK